MSASKEERLEAAVAERDEAYRAWNRAGRAWDEARLTLNAAVRKLRKIEEEP